MNEIIVGFIGIIALLCIIALKMPCSFAMMVVGFCGMLYFLSPNAAFRFFATDIFNEFSSYNMSVIPMFVIMGYYAAMSGITTRAYDIAYIWLGWLRGGLCIATIISCAVFAAVCGSSAATSATIGKIAFPSMKSYGYDETLSTGCIAGGGLLGPLIPPSNGLIVYGLLTQTSIGKLFTAVIIPGLIAVLLFSVWIYILCRIRPDLGPSGPRTTWKIKIGALSGLIEVFIVFLICIGGLFGGWFTPTQAGSAGVFGVLLVGLARKSITVPKLWSATKEGLLVACMILCLVAGAVVFSHFLSLSKLPMFLTDYVKSLTVQPLVILLIVCVFYIIGGCFMDSMGLMVVSLPIVFPIIFKLGYDPVWFGVIILLLIETGVITPPIGVNVYVVKAIAPDVPLERIFKGVVPYFICTCILIILLIAFPDLATFLPSLMFS